jgi:bifunctional DNA-binding transcriptional regulator/antitoxin component of YhaV-PrlF toxin-antitoxin module
MKVYTTALMEDGEDVVFNFPDEILSDLKLKVGDTVEWVIHEDYVIMKKVEQGLDAQISDSE